MTRMRNKSISSPGEMHEACQDMPDFVKSTCTDGFSGFKNRFPEYKWGIRTFFKHLWCLKPLTVSAKKLHDSSLTGYIVRLCDCSGYLCIWYIFPAIHLLIFVFIWDCLVYKPCYNQFYSSLVRTPVARESEMSYQDYINWWNRRKKINF